MDNEFDSHEYSSLHKIPYDDVQQDYVGLSQALNHAFHSLTMNDCLATHDPLAQVQHLTIEPMKLTYVEPHWVNGYFRADGTYVQGYFRDGDGNTNVFDGDGYYRKS